MPRLICIGMSAHDCIYSVRAIPTTPTKVLATEYRECGGGMAANASVAAARLGAEVAYWGRVGDDALGSRITAELADERVDVDHVRRVPGAISPSAAILVDGCGERLICAFNDVTLDRDACWLPLDDIDASDAVLADVRWPEGAKAALMRAHERGKLGVLDADVCPRDDLLALIPHARYVVFSEGGLAGAFGDGPPDQGLRKAATRTAAVVGVTLGAKGFLWLDGDGREQRLASIPVEAVDTLAAGDVWHAAFTVMLAEGQAIREAAAFANVAAAIKCERPGGRRGAPSREEVSARLKLNALANF